MSKTRKITGWALTILLGLLFLASAAGKLARAEPVVKQLTDFGLKDQMLLIGAGEAISALLFLIPITHPLGVLLLSGYMGGAIVTHMQHGEPYVVQSVILALIWVSAFLRRPSMLMDPRPATLAHPTSTVSGI